MNDKKSNDRNPAPTRISTPESSQYEHLEYDETSGVLRVQFKHRRDEDGYVNRMGPIYRYWGEPQNGGTLTLGQHFAHILAHHGKCGPDDKPFSVGSYVIANVTGKFKDPVKPFQYAKVEDPK